MYTQELHTLIAPVEYLGQLSIHIPSIKHCIASRIAFRDILMGYILPGKINNKSQEEEIESNTHGNLTKVSNLAAGHLLLSTCFEYCNLPLTTI